jgi:hypothetical protein
MAWYLEFNSTFWITLATIITGSIGLSIKYCLKSKCGEIKLCYGLVEINRNVELEAEEEMKEMELGIRRQPSGSPMTHSPAPRL